MKILAIDDNPDNLTSLKAVVADRLPEVKILTALSGVQGLEIARAEAPDVILLDVVMPDMDGYAVCRKLKADATLKMIPVLFLTALKTDRDSRVKALESGAEGFICKPFDDLELCAQIRSMAKIKAASLVQQKDKEQLAALVDERTRELQQSKISMLNLLEDLQAENRARKQGDQALRESEEEFRLLFNCSRDAVLVHEFTAEKLPGRFIEANTEACRRYGYTHAELLTMTPMDLDAPDGLAAIPAAMQRLSAEGHAEWEGAHLTRDKRRMNVEIVNVLFNFRGETMIMSVVRDVTERKQAAAEQARQMEELKRWQTATLGREGRVGELKREVNALAVRFGQPPPYATPDELEHEATQ